MAGDELKQLIVRVEPQLIHQIKVIAAQQDISMAEIIRVELRDFVGEQRQKPWIDKALEAAGL